MPEPHTDPTETPNGQKGGSQQGQYGQAPPHQPGQMGQQSPDDLKRRARNSEAEDQMRNAGREVAERFADRSRGQIDRYERAFGEFWKVAESDGFMPFARSIARANMEVAALASRRAKAYAEFPVQLSQCQSTNDMMNRQMRFVSDAINDWQETVGRMTRTWAEGANPQQMLNQFGEITAGGPGHQQSSGQHHGQQAQQPGSQQGQQQQYGGGGSSTHGGAGQGGPQFRPR